MSHVVVEHAFWLDQHVSCKEPTRVNEFPLDLTWFMVQCWLRTLVPISWAPWTGGCPGAVEEQEGGRNVDCGCCLVQALALLVLLSPGQAQWQLLPFFLLLLDYFRQTLSYTFFCYLLLWLFQNRDWKSYSIKGQIVNTQVLQAKRQNQGYYAAAYMIREKINFHEFFYWLISKYKSSSINLFVIHPLIKKNGILSLGEDISLIWGSDLMFFIIMVEM